MDYSEKFSVFCDCRMPECSERANYYMGGGAAGAPIDFLFIKPALIYRREEICSCVISVIERDNLVYDQLSVIEGARVG